MSEVLREYRITNLSNAKALAAKLRRRGQDAHQEGDSVIVARRSRPWAELAGHMTNDTQIVPGPALDREDLCPDCNGRGVVRTGWGEDCLCANCSGAGVLS